MQPLISIITVTYNAENHLGTTIKSIASQTYKNIEYIVVDGDSKDSTLNIIKQNRSIIDKWISEPDKGLYDAMNKGLIMATGDYVWFMNAGDLIYAPDTITNILSEITDADVYYGQAMVIDEKGKDIGLRRLKPGKDFSWKSYRNGQLICHQSFIAKRDLCPPYDLGYKCSADTDWQIKILRKAKKLRDTNQILSRFLDGGRSKQTIIPSLKERWHIMVKNFGWFSTIAAHIFTGIRFFVFYSRNKRF